MHRGHLVSEGHLELKLGLQLSKRTSIISWFVKLSVRECEVLETHWSYQPVWLMEVGMGMSQKLFLMFGGKRMMT
jgi:hypothetical protein